MSLLWLISQFHSWLKCWWSHDLKCQQAVPHLLPSTIAHCSCSFISRPPSSAARQQALPLLAPPTPGFFAQTGYCFICAALPLDSNQTTVPVFVSATQFSRANKLFLSLTHSLRVSRLLTQTNRQLVPVNRIKQACLLFTSPTLRWQTNWLFCSGGPAPSAAKSRWPICLSLWESMG